MEKPKAEMLFEASWEVCNKVGGIYTVVLSKAAILDSLYKEYYLIGPFFPEKAKMETQQALPPPLLRRAFDELEKKGIICYFGKWQVKGEPNVILLDFKSMIGRKDEIKRWLWEKYRIDSLYSRWDFEEPMVWAYAVGELLTSICKTNPGRKAVAHLHEWLAGVAALHLKENCPEIKTVFTTHATMLGRSIAGSGQPFYSMLESIDPESVARDLGVIDKFTTERACAENSSVFTTVSEITSIEAERLLGKKADVLLLNGLDTERFPTFEENSINHRLYRDVLREFITYYFFPYYKFDIDESLIYFIVGRYEFKNKGLDVMIKALGRLNKRLISQKSKKTIITFFWIPSEVKGIRADVLENEELYHQMTEIIERNERAIKERLLSCLVTGRDPPLTKAFDEDFMKDMRRLILKFRKMGNPSIISHIMANEYSDPIINSLKENGLLNRPSDMVKTVFFPVYLDGSDGLVNLAYYNALVGTHLGIFPSYYEPWGYTPLESAALSIPAVTTDLAGFGRFIKQKEEAGQGGIFVLERFNRSDDEIVERLADIMYKYTLYDQKQRVEQKMLAKKLSEYADWNILIEEYIKAHNLALER